MATGEENMLCRDACGHWAAMGVHPKLSPPQHRCSMPLKVGVVVRPIVLTIHVGTRQQCSVEVKPLFPYMHATDIV